MTRLRSVLVILAACLAAALMLTAPASQAAIVQAAHNPTVAANLTLVSPDTQAKKAELTVTARAAALKPGQVWCGTPATKVCRVMGEIYRDSNYTGWSTRMVYLDHGDCDGTGYTFAYGFGSVGRAGSSIRREAGSPNCNAAIVTTTYGGTVGMCLSKPYVGNAANDQIAKVRVYRDLNCPRYWYYT